jgi:hypothetical protein
MGKSLLELLGERNTNTPEIVKPKPVIPSVFGDVIKKYAGEEIYTREEKNAAQTINFVKNVPRIYGLDAKRILLQRDPHADKVLIKKAAGAVGGLLGPVGAAVGNFLADFNPKYPDDFLTGDASEPKFNLYSKLISSDYAGGKYYNGGVKNNKSKLGSFLQGNRTPQQIKDNAVAAAKTMIIGAAIAGVGKLLTRKKRKENPAKKLPPPVPFFPSTFVLNSTTTLNDSDSVAHFQEQQRNNPLFPSKFGKDLSTTRIVGKDELVPREDELANLDTLYSNHIELYLRKNNQTDTRELYDNFGYYTSLTINNGVEDSYKRVGRYSKDVLRIFQASKTDPQTGEPIPETWDRYDTIKQFEDANPNWDNLIPDTGLLRFGTQNVSSLELGGQINLVQNNLDNWLSYNPIAGSGSVDYSKYWIKPVRWNGREAKYSDQSENNLWAYGNSQKLNKILDQDYYFASESFQSQANSFNKKYNPYLQIRREVLDTSVDSSITDRIKFKIGDVKLLGTLTGLTDATTPNWSSVKGVGSGFHFYGYDHWEREVSFRIRLYAESESDLKNIWIKANQIKTYTLPIPQKNLGVFGRIIKLQIGDLINESYGFLTQCEMNVLDESPWEITDGLQKPFIFDMNITYKVVYNKDNFPHYPVQIDKKAYEIQTKPQTAEPVVIGAPPQFGNTETDDQLDSSPLRSTDTSTVNRDRSSTRLNAPPTTLSGTTRVEPDSMQAWTRARSVD